MIQSASAHTNQNVVLAKRRIRNIFIPENFRPTEFVNADSFHVINITRRRHSLQRSRIRCNISSFGGLDMRSASLFRFSTLLLSFSLLMPGLNLIARAEDAPAHPILPIGSLAPDFCLPGIDGKNHCLKDYTSSKVLVIAFTCNHCPTAQLYEQRIMKLV